MNSESVSSPQVVRELMQFHTHTHGIVMGGAARKPEAEKLGKGANGRGRVLVSFCFSPEISFLLFAPAGVNLLVATPGRLLDHMQNTRNFTWKNLQILVS
jgi:ATP-dependent RNA helicase DDX18/HAS1